MKDLDKVYAEKIAEEYAPKKASKVVALKKLDQKVKQPAYVFAYVFGAIGSLVLGIGMCFSMGVIGNDDVISMIIGCIIGIFGIAMCLVNYPIYKKILVARKNKYAFEITELAREITNEE